MADATTTAAPVKERPILFTGAMVRAILAGTKTQTRRLVKPVGRDGGFVVYDNETLDAWPYRSDDGESCYHTTWTKDGRYCLHETPIECPHGAAGDRLWVRETFSESEPCFLGGKAQPTVWYRANNNRPTWAERRWRPSIFMRRPLSRLLLEVTDVRVQRLQDISEADAKAEGIEYVDDGRGHYGVRGVDGTHGWTAAESYGRLWESINGAGSWDRNPWVWAVNFRRVTP